MEVKLTHSSLAEAKKILADSPLTVRTPVIGDCLSMFKDHIKNGAEIYKATSLSIKLEHMQHYGKLLINWSLWSCFVSLQKVIGSNMSATCSQTRIRPPTPHVYSSNILTWWRKCIEHGQDEHDQKPNFSSKARAQLNIGPNSVTLWFHTHFRFIQDSRCGDAVSFLISWHLVWRKVSCHNVSWQLWSIIFWSL